MVGGAKPTIRMIPGTYPVDLVVPAGVAATIIGTGATLTGSGQTTPIVSTAENTSLSIRGLTIQTAAARTGVYCSSSIVASPSTVILSDVDVEAADLSGQSIRAIVCHLTVAKTKILANVEAEDKSTVSIDRTAIGGMIALGSGKELVLNVTNSTAATIGLPGAAPFSTSGQVSFTTFGNVPGTFNCVRLDGSNNVVNATVFSNDIFSRDPSIGGNFNTVTGDPACFDYDVEFPEPTPVGTHITAANPKLLDAMHGDFHILAGSPAIDAADPAATDNVDYDGTMRPQGAGRDLGAFEYH